MVSSSPRVRHSLRGLVEIIYAENAEPAEPNEPLCASGGPRGDRLFDGLRLGDIGGVPVK